MSWPSPPAFEAIPPGLRVGAVSYLNAKPLYYRLTEWAPELELTIDVPSRLASGLRDGTLDVALVPSIEAIRGAVSEGLTILPQLAIAARKEVRSVKLFARTPWKAVRRLALDEGSRTSQALCRIWLAEVQGVCPETIETHPLGVPIEESLADAVLLIGDRAMTVNPEPFVAVVDLAHAWNVWTGLPFVFAVWAVRPGVDLGGLPHLLIHCRDQSLAQADLLAQRFGVPLGLDRAEALDYLTQVLSYDLGPTELRALRLFARKAAALGLAPEGVDLVFHQPPRGLPLETRR
jgi:chorismate dehydratase